MREAAAEALKYVRDGNGPMILGNDDLSLSRAIRCPTRRKYRTREEVDEMRKGHDPIDHLGLRIVESGAATEEKLKEIDREIRTRVAEAAEFATDAPEPEAAELWTDILVDA